MFHFYPREDHRKHGSLPAQPKTTYTPPKPEARELNRTNLAIFVGGEQGAEFDSRRPWHQARVLVEIIADRRTDSSLHRLSEVSAEDAIKRLEEFIELATELKDRIE